MLALVAKFPVNLYTNTGGDTLLRVKNCGSVDYWSEMPKVFRYSKINLNFTIPNIKSGLPLRIFDVLGAGGFLLTNYQEDFLNYFVPGEDFIYYSSYEEAETYADYYLSHEKERQQIAANALGKILEAHTFEHRIQTMLSVIDGQ